VPQAPKGSTPTEVLAGLVERVTFHNETGRVLAKFGVLTVKILHPIEWMQGTFIVFRITCHWYERFELNTFSRNDYADATELFVAFREFIATHTGEFHLKFADAQLTFALDPDLSTIFPPAALFPARLAWRQGGQRRAGCFKIAATGGNISVAPFYRLGVWRLIDYVALVNEAG